MASAALIDVPAGSLMPTSSMSTARSGHIATRLADGRVLITGGRDASGTALSSAELFE